MIIVVILIVLVIGFVLYKFNNDNEAFLEIALFLIIIMLFGGFAMATLNRKVTKEYEEQQYEIQGLENELTNSQEIKGTFILGFGSVKSEQKNNLIYYFFRTDEIGKKLETIDGKVGTDLYIRETDKQKPCLINRYQVTEFTGIYRKLFWKNRQTTEIARVLVVPKNTIKIEYNVDLK